jgi:hypothetical protein
MKSPLGLEARIPVFELFKDALFLLWAKRGRLLSMFLPIILVLVVLDRYSAAITEPIMAAMGQEGGNMEMGFPLEFWIVTGISGLLSVLLATTVHRFTLQDASHWPSNALRVPNRSDWRYLLRSLQLVFVSAGAGLGVTVVAMVILGVVTGASDPAAMQQVVGLAFIPAFMLMLYILARLSITLPEIAIGTKGSDLGRAWRMSKGNGTRLVIVALALPLLVNLPFLLLVSLENVVTDIVAAFGIYSMTLISITVLSLSYQFLLEFYEPDEGEEVTPEKDDDDGMDA